MCVGGEVLRKRRSSLGSREALPKFMNILSLNKNGGTDGGVVRGKLTLLVSSDVLGSGISSILRVWRVDGAGVWEF